MSAKRESNTSLSTASKALLVGAKMVKGPVGSGIVLLVATFCDEKIGLQNHAIELKEPFRYVITVLRKPGKEDLSARPMPGRTSHASLTWETFSLLTSIGNSISQSSGDNQVNQLGESMGREDLGKVSSLLRWQQNLVDGVNHPVAG